ncbi:MAG: hypothetical protein QXI12_11295, partial [Candidatus Methanomethyliaceae archaeon]
HKSPHCGPVLLPHMSLVVLLVRAAAGERYLLSCTVPGKMAIEKSAVIVRIGPKKREGQVPTHPVDGLLHRLLFTIREDLELTPPGIQIHGGQGVEVFALGALPKVAQGPPPGIPV